MLMRGFRSLYVNNPTPASRSRFRFGAPSPLLLSRKRGTGGRWSLPASAPALVAAIVDRVDASEQEPASVAGEVASFRQRYEIDRSKPHLAGATVQLISERPGPAASRADLQP